MTVYIRDLPQELAAMAFWHRLEPAWRRRDALRVVDWMEASGVAPLGVEIWLKGTDGPVIPEPIIYTWTAEERDPGEPWAGFVTRAAVGARDYIRSFVWDASDVGHQKDVPYFFIESSDPP